MFMSNVNSGIFVLGELVKYLFASLADVNCEVFWIMLVCTGGAFALTLSFLVALGVAVALRTQVSQ